MNIYGYLCKELHGDIAKEPSETVHKPIYLAYLLYGLC